MEVVVRGMRMKLGSAIKVEMDEQSERSTNEPNEEEKSMEQILLEELSPEEILREELPDLPYEQTRSEEKPSKQNTDAEEPKQEISNGSRKRVHEEEVETAKCPICGMTLKPDYLQDHLEAELQRLEKVTSHAPKSSDLSNSGKKKSRRKHATSASEEKLTHHERYQTYLRVRHAREKRKAVEKEQLTNCPVCNRSISGTDEELSQHVNKCLNGGAHLEDDVDIEGEYDDFDEYTWAGQTRVRATSMLSGGLADLGNIAVHKPNDEDTESDLDVDGDTTDQFGERQYDESDLMIIPDEDSAESSSAVRDVLIEGSSRTRTISDVSILEPTVVCDTGPSTSSPRRAGEESSSVIASLKARVQELVDSKDQQVRCLICMDSYKQPLVSVQCWHVYCEDCWLRTLGAKKLCPQCNMITSPVDLRRIYL
ncbi:hypothetical protein CAPTEDRAFT_162028 [Capitella teleta]|uniref:RING-type domain-containing protein n=1 Tax=Capitella teleta TaxID=283909 RepID=R7VG23_CAPTE|nr:hypothetical protein CAPTEDRAFT_162028 [Capitella teleta]|eukprot:ELU14630.1 hypothetical protein CAPTEDRAFT_162028 [Capitella teleta]